MRYAIISDIHSNLEAFESVLDDMARNGSYDKIWCLGDIVGYGPDPHACIELLSEQNQTSIVGNHDLASMGLRDTFDFNQNAALAAEWTKQQLTANDIKFLLSLPEKVIEGDFTLVHGSPRDPINEYVLSEKIAVQNLHYFETQCCLVGHSHIPFIFDSRNRSLIMKKFQEKRPVILGEHRLIINPGGVGQPRDNDPRASYAVYDSNAGTITNYRVKYDIAVTQAKMEKEGLPQFLISRLTYGV